ncbi:MAG: protein phosphatase CheZ [Alphaproteobacteria bacterium]|nr:protein phosphatase CheZ [Alphaproteobacteria bacterium]
MHALQLDQADGFVALESAVRETARGRAFLDEYARRLRATETDRVLDAIDRLSQIQNERPSSNHLDVLRRELETMSASIAQTRREIAAIKPETSGNNRIVQATEELDFVVRSTERATAEILTAAEGIQTIAGDLKTKGAETAVCDELENHATNLMIACSFQDLTGQRMTKVVNVLHYLEQRVNTMIEIWGITPEEAAKVKQKLPDARPDAHLLNGPAREGEGVAQHDVDRLLNETDAGSAPANTTASQDDIDALFK